MMKMKQTTFISMVVALLWVPVVSADHHGGDTEKGEALFETKCSVCHFSDSNEKKIGPGLAGIKNGKLPSGKDATQENLIKNINEGGGGMPAFEKLLTDEEKGYIIALLKTL
jgi:mono/diheme cytochrome c family protein